MSVSTEVYSLKTKKKVVAAPDVVDEDSLLTEEDRATKAPQDAGDCSTSKRACKNCTCGRAELERAGATANVESAEFTGAPSGGCGNCSRGDAFRCANCPYLGKPGWKTDEATGKVTLNMQDDL
eukprot:PhM_4_TR794/c0_g3_i1/m.12096